MFDEVLVEIARKRLVAVQALLSRNLRFNVPDALGVTMLQWETVSDMTPAEVSMSGITPAQGDRLNFEDASLPLPIVHKDFHLNIRHLKASRKLGTPLDVAQVTMASTLVTEAIEAMVFTGHAITVKGNTIPGLLNHTYRNTGSVSANWDTAATGAQMVTDIIAMISACQTDNMYGPYGLFVTNAAFLRMMDDFKTESDKTILQRLKEIEGIQFILPSKDVTAGAVVLTQLSNDVIQEVVGIQPTVVSWESQGGMQFNFKVLAIMVPRIRSTQTNQSGVAHFS